jgi:hypothetical protein
MESSSGANGAAVHPHTMIGIETTTVRNVDVVQSRRGVAFDAVNLLPASIFRRIPIGHTGGIDGELQLRIFRLRWAPCRRGAGLETAREYR